MANKILQTISFSNVNNWSVQYLLEINHSYNDKFDFVKIGTFLTRNKTQIDISDEKRYKRVTIKINNGGVFLRDIEYGVNIGTKKQFLISKGQFLLSKIDARNGAFGVVPDELDGAIITGNFWAFDVDYSKVNPYFLSLIVTSPSFVKFSENASNGTTNRHYLQESLFLAQEIPLPSLEEQKSIIETYNQKLALAAEQASQSAALEEQIERYLFEQLGIDYQKKQLIKKGLNLINYTKLFEWGADKLLNANRNVLLSKKFSNKLLSQIVLINPRTDLSNIGEYSEMSFIPMECVSDDYGEIIELRAGLKKSSSGYTKFIEGDLIWARITPCMQNGKSTIVHGLKNGVGYGSTEFHVLRTLNNDIDLEFIYHLLRTKTVRQDATKYFTGSAGQQRVPKSYLENLSIPVPPLKKQQEISNNINSIKAQIKELNLLSEQNKVLAIKEFEEKIFQ